MENTNLSHSEIAVLKSAFGKKLREKVPLARHTSARVGGPADWLIETRSIQEVIEVVSLCWSHHIPHLVLGGGSNVLVSDAGVRGLVVLNKANAVSFDSQANPPTVWAESGANFGLIARQAAVLGLAGLEWAAGIPGSVGGAVVGNAGAHGGDISGNLLMADILHRNISGQDSSPQRENWPVEKLEYSYRSSVLRRQPGRAVVLAALLSLERSQPNLVKARMEEYKNYRRKTQPAGASMGSMFKNPPGDYAGRLIEAAGLKGLQVGAAQISPLHGNFFINLGQASAQDIYSLINLARQTVAEKFAIDLELEIQLVGEW